MKHAIYFDGTSYFIDSINLFTEDELINKEIDIIQVHENFDYLSEEVDKLNEELNY